MPTGISVGYQTTQELAGDATAAITMFRTVGGEGFDIRGIVPAVDPDKGEMATSDLQIQLVESDTSAGTVYQWTTEEDARYIEKNPEATAGWFDAAGVTRLAGEHAVVFPQGSGFLLVNNFWDNDGGQEGLTVTYSGEVAKESTIMQLEMDANAAGNNSTQPLDIQDIEVGCVCKDGVLYVVDPDDESIKLATSDIQIQLVEPDTSAGTVYQWTTEEDARYIEKNPEATAGWFDAAGVNRLVNEHAVVFPSGAGFLFVNNFWDGDMFVKIPVGIEL